MKFNGSIEIEKPLSRVVALFTDATKLKEWQEGFVEKKLVNGSDYQEGAISMLYYKNGKHEMELKETVVANNLPESFEAFYEHKHMDNSMTCRFTAINDRTTQYSVEVEYTRINWFFPKLMALLFPSMYRKPAQKWMDNFKSMAERE